MWQDVLLSVGNFGFILGLLPSALNKVVLPLTTSLVTALIMTAFVVVYATLGMWLTFSATLMTSCLWWYLTYISVRKH